MATSTCIKCGSHSFEMIEAEPKGSNFVVMFIQCANCGGVVGVCDFFNIGDLVKRLATKLKVDIFN